MQYQMMPRGAFTITMKTGPHCLLSQSHHPSNWIYSASHKNWLSYFAIMLCYLPLSSLRVSGFCRHRYIIWNQELTLEKSRICMGAGGPWHMAYWCGSLNLRVKMKKLGWMNIVTSRLSCGYTNVTYYLISMFPICILNLLLKAGITKSCENLLFCNACSISIDIFK